VPNGRLIGAVRLMLTLKLTIASPTTGGTSVAHRYQAPTKRTKPRALEPAVHLT
jgi:hypothetical protein